MVLCGTAGFIKLSKLTKPEFSPKNDCGSLSGFLAVAPVELVFVVFVDDNGSKSSNNSAIYEQVRNIIKFVEKLQTIMISNLPLLLLIFDVELFVVSKSTVLFRFVIISNSSISGEGFYRKQKNSVNIKVILHCVKL